jgi:cyclophilin family peptidyl-prolyl cis-trans isomerase
MKYSIILLCFALVAISVADAQKKNKSKIKIEKRMETKNITVQKGMVVIETSLGNITIALNDSSAPKHSANFRKLAKEGFYDSTTFHRVIPGFMIQGGDPNSKDDDRNNDGLGGPPYSIDAEIGLSHDSGVIAAARLGDMVNPKRQSNGSQFYITVAEAKFLDGQYSVFGKVVDGFDVAEKIVAVPRDSRDNPINKVIIKKVTVVE